MKEFVEKYDLTIYLKLFLGYIDVSWWVNLIMSQIVGAESICFWLNSQLFFYLVSSGNRFVIIKLRFYKNFKGV